MQMKPSVHIPHSLLPESQNWEVGRKYKVKATLKQVSAHEDGAMFEIENVVSLMLSNKSRKKYLSDGGTYIA